MARVGWDVTHGCFCPLVSRSQNTACICTDIPRTYVRTCVRYTRELVRAMGWPLFDCPPRNRVMSRHVGRLCSPIKSISENSRGELVFFSRPNVIHHTSRPSSSERGAPLARLFLPVVDSRPFRPSRLVWFIAYSSYLLRARFSLSLSLSLYLSILARSKGNLLPAYWRISQALKRVCQSSIDCHRLSTSGRILSCSS